jgi:DNA mismatch endonuclease (patch repair protein)
MTRWPGKPRKERTTFGGLCRSDLMSRIGSYGNQTTELKMVELLRRDGLKGWRRHLSLPGKPDFAWPEKKVALFVDGCFWHGHSCKRNLKPKVNVKKWEEKISGNKRRDRRSRRLLRGKGWKVIRIWECQLSRNPKNCLKRIRKLVGDGD